MIGDPYQDDEQTAKIMQPEPAPRNTRGLKIIGLIVCVALALVIVGNVVASIAARVSPQPAAPKPKTMTLNDSEDFSRQQAGQASFLRGVDRDAEQRTAMNQVLGQATGLAGDPTPAPAIAAPVAQVQTAPGSSTAEQEYQRRLQEAERRRQADMDASPLAVDFSSYFSKEDDLKKRLGADGVPASRDAQDAADAASAERTLYSPLLKAITPNDVSAMASTQDRPKQPHDPKADYPFDSSNGKLYRLMEGHVIESVLVNRLTGAAAGPVITMVTTDVYSETGKHLLIPKGSRLLGSVTAVGSINQERLFVAFHRLIMPDGYSVSLDQFKGLDVVGQTGLRDLVNHHYTQIFGASLALAAIAATTNIGNNSGFGTYNWDVQMRAGMSQEMGQSAQRVMERFLNVLPTFTIRERTRVTVMLANDLVLPDSKTHTMDPDL